MTLSYAAVEKKKKDLIPSQIDPSKAMSELVSQAPTEPRLTSLSHGGGCGCKIAPGVLSEILKNTPAMPIPKELLVGIETSDDAAVYQVSEDIAIVATTDFFMPIVDDPFDFGRIAATNAISDVYAMGGRPIMALAIVGMPIKVLSTDTIGKILAGGASVCNAAGIPIAGGHSIDSVEPIYGLIAIGVINPAHVKRNSSSKVGDVLILGKPLGVGILAAGLKKNYVPPEGYDEMIANTCKLNTPGPDLAKLPGVHALTDVTGFGLAGHGLELARGGQVHLQIQYDQVPKLNGIVELIGKGAITGATGRNWLSYGHDVEIEAQPFDVTKAVVTDPQTSGGLLVSCDPNSVDEVLTIFRNHGFEHAAVIGQVVGDKAPGKISFV